MSGSTNTLYIIILMLFLMLLFYTYLIYFFNSFDLSYVLFDTVDLDLIHRHTLCKMTKM